LELRKAELREAGPRDAPRDDKARFLGELRQLRTDAGLGHAELAARAHYPCEVIRGVEAGPSLPSLPVLSAFVRGCGGTPGVWEERWRSLTRSPASPLLPVRAVGDSDAATAGARVGAATPAADGHNPDFILAALGRVAGSIAAEPADAAMPDIPLARDEAPADSVISGGLPSPGADSWAAPAAAAPAPAQAPAAATAAGVPAGLSPEPAARSSRLRPNWETTATIVAVLILIVILLAIFA
jgi:hypothetical protein